MVFEPPLSRVSGAALLRPSAGWRAALYTVALLGAPALPVLAATPEAGTPHAKLMVNVRESPDLSSRIVAVLKKGDAPTVLAEQGEFVQLRTPSGTVGYLRHRNLAGYRASVAAAAPAAPPVVARLPEPPVEAYRSPYPAPALQGFAPRANRSGAAPAPITLLASGKPSLWQITAGFGATLSAQSSEDLRNELGAEGFAGQVAEVNQAAPGGFLRLSYSLGSPIRVEAALVYLGDLDLRLRAPSASESGVLAVVDEHAVGTGLGLAPTLAYQWRRVDQALTLRGGAFIGVGEGQNIRFNDRSVNLDGTQTGALVGASWESRLPSGLWAGVDAQAMYLNDWIGLISLTARWGE